MTDPDLIATLAGIVGSAQVLTAEQDKAPYLTDWRKRYAGQAQAVVRPANTGEVAAVVRACAATRTPLVPQGGNTGLVGGGTPDASGKAIVLSLNRMRAIRAVDPVNNTLTAEAGCILASVQQAAREHGRLFPLSLAAEGSCTVGGNLSTNAGGVAVLRYGNTRELCLAIEAVTPAGDIVGGRDGMLHGLRKDNTGYDWKDLLIGAEGTLGIITAAVLKLYPLPRAQVTALAALNSPREALQLLALAQAHCGATLTAFELVSDYALGLVEKHFAQPSPFGERYPYLALLEISDHEDEAHAISMIEALMEGALEQELVRDATVAQNISQSRKLWALRENISEAQAAEGKNIKHDISVPISRIADFIDVTSSALESRFPGVRLVNFGHLGDGNLHYNVSPAPGFGEAEFLALQPEINLLVHDSVHAHGGSISAEHGLGQLKREEILRYKPQAELNLMRLIKNALDPLGIMNPGKVI